MHSIQCLVALIKEIWGSTRCVVVNVLNPDIVVSEFKLPSSYYIQFRPNILGKGMSLLIPQAMSLIVPQLFFIKHSFRIKQLTKVDVPFNTENELHQTKILMAPVQSL